MITTTAGATGFVSESVNYLDVGLKLEVEPHGAPRGRRRHQGRPGGEQHLARGRRPRRGTVAYQVGTRNAATTLRLRDGETQVLAGLINDEDRRSADKVPGLRELPVIGRLFSNNDDTVNKTEIVLLITPRVMRNIERPGARIEEFNSGTELEVGGARLSACRSAAPRQSRRAQPRRRRRPPRAAGRRAAQPPAPVRRRSRKP